MRFGIREKQFDDMAQSIDALLLETENDNARIMGNEHEPHKIASNYREGLMLLSAYMNGRPNETFTQWLSERTEREKRTIITEAYKTLPTMYYGFGGMAEK